MCYRQSPSQQARDAQRQRAKNDTEGEAFDRDEQNQRTDRAEKVREEAMEAE